MHRLAQRKRSGAGTSVLRRSLDEPTAFGLFYSEHAEALLTYFLRRTFDVEVARDLTAETFAEAFQHRGRFRGSSDSEATGWLYGIARHQMSRYMRRGAVERRALHQLSIEVPEITSADSEQLLAAAGIIELRTQLKDAVSKLPPAQRQALELRILADLPYPEVARRLRISETSARARVSRALRTLAGGTGSRELREVAGI